METLIANSISIIFMAGAFWLFWTLGKTLTNIQSFKAFSKTLSDQPWPVKLMFLNILWFPTLAENIINSMGDKFLTKFINVYGYFLYFFAFACAGATFFVMILQFGVSL